MASVRLKPIFQPCTPPSHHSTWLITLSLPTLLSLLQAIKPPTDTLELWIKVSAILDIQWQDVPNVHYLPQSGVPVAR